MEDSMKTSWHDVRFYSLTPEQRADIMHGRRHTTLQQLAERYLHFSNMAFVMMAIIPFSVFHVVLKEADMTLKLVWMIFAILFFGLAGIIDRWLYSGIKSIDCSTMTVNEVSRKSLFYRKRHLQSVMILLPMAVLFIGGMLYLTEIDVYVIYGMIIGGIVGLAVGGYNLYKFMSDYKALRDDH